MTFEQNIKVIIFKVLGIRSLLFSRRKLGPSCLREEVLLCLIDSWSRSCSWSCSYNPEESAYEPCFVLHSVSHNHMVNVDINKGM